MNQSKKIEFSKSTFVSLKAELLRKQDEVNKAKLQSKNQIENFVPSSKFAKDTDVGPKSSDNKPATKDVEDTEIHRKSKEMLERKALLYDNLSQSASIGDGEEYLVNFEKKNKEENIEVVPPPLDEYQNLSPPLEKQEDAESSDDEEWVDYVDCLGRTRRCHKTDIEHIKNQDEMLNLKLNGPPPNNDIVVTEKAWVKEGEITDKNLPPIDPYKEQLRKQWEQKEEEITKKGSVHYEDVLFNEARSHGVGYYALSGDASERAAQQAALATARAETERARVAAAEARQRREEALQARVKAARARQRARAGLPPEEEEEEDPKSKVTSMLLDFVEEQKRVSSEKVAEEARKQRESRDAEAKKARQQFIREWDEGKEKLPHNRHVELTQEQWVEKKRKERQEEFAPPQTVTSKTMSANDSRTFNQKGFYFDTQGERSNPQTKNLSWSDVRKPGAEIPSTSQTQTDTSLFFTTKMNIEAIKNKYVDTSVNVGESSFNPVPIRNECSDEDEDKTEPRDTGANAKTQKRGAEIEPPSTYEYFGPVEKKGKLKDGEKVNVSEAFEKGVKYLEQQAASKDKRKDRAFLDNM